MSKHTDNPYNFRGIHKLAKGAFSAHLFNGDKFVGKVTRGRSTSTVVYDLNSATYRAELDEYLAKASLGPTDFALILLAGW